jgi:WD40 repeat protein
MKHDGVINTLAFSPDGRLVAASYVDDRTLRLWDTQSFQPVGDPMRFDSGVSVATFSPDGRVVAAGGGDGSIRLWTVDDQTQLGAPLTVHKSAVSSLDFSPDGSKLLSASEDHTLRMSPAPNPSPDALCAKLTHDMSLGDWNKVVSPEIDYIKVCPELPDDDDSG